MNEDYGNATLTWLDDGTVVVKRADDTIGIAADLLAELTVGEDGVLVLDTAGKYRYRFAHESRTTPHVLVFRRITEESAP